MSKSDSSRVKKRVGRMSFVLRLLLIIFCLTALAAAFALLRGQMLVTRYYRVEQSLFRSAGEVSSDSRERSSEMDASETGFEIDGRRASPEESEGMRTASETQTGKNASQVRIVGLADLHGRMIGFRQRALAEQVRAAEPDLIVYLGDMVDRSRASKSEEALILLTKSLIEIAPIYYVDGNHEEDMLKDAPEIYEHLNRELARIGAVHLENETVQVKVGGERTAGDGIIVNLCGISTHYYWGEKEDTEVDKLRAMDGVNVLICHYPESVMWYKTFEGGGLDVALCGHTHGGLIRVPFKGGLYAPEQSRWPRYDLGAYPIYSDTTWRYYGGDAGSGYLGTMVISGGLAGEHGVPRINNPKEISVVDVGIAD